MNTLKTCPKCKEPLPANTVRGLCPKCLAMVALGSGSEDKTMIVQPPVVGTVKPALNSTLHYFGDYELLDEIARGGMGVVFKARQVRLNRTVAVKMILSGQLAGEAEVKRFHTEAEAAANLQHPNIVAIHEVGEHEGRHYFSMDYIEGENLAEFLKKNTLSATQVAQLMKTIADAIHFAHQRGTLHRDLKPHNILIDGNGQPHITDFGLAKRIETDSGLTQSGAVMGSPAYMPPEQATGRNAEVGPVSDVYSLGAILYQMLTGRAPFTAETPLATLQKVVSEEPAAPSKMNSKTPHDLETICLKCLEKKPERRYHSARELADELGRFLKQEPILARPASAGRKTWNWLVRNPWALTGAAAMLVLGLIGLAVGLWEQNQAMKWSMAHGRPSSAAAAATPGNFTISRGWWVAAIIFNGMLFAPFAFADFVDRKRRNMTVTPFHLRFYIGLAIAQILVALIFTRQIIHESVWNGFDARKLFISLFTVLSPLWFGALMLWHVVAQMRASTFGVEHKNERQLFAPKQDYWTVEQCQPINLYIISAAVLVLIGALLQSKTLPVMALFSGGATILLLGYRGEKTANRSLRLFLGIMFAAMTVMMCWQGYQDRVYLATSLLERWTRQWSNAFGAVIGVACGVLIFRSNRGRTGHTPCNAHEKLWPAYHKTALKIIWLQPVVLLWVIGSAGIWATFPFLFLVWRVSEGIEKRVNATFAGAIGLLMVALMADNKKFSLDLWPSLGAFGIGCLLAAVLHFLEKRAARLKVIR